MAMTLRNRMIMSMLSLVALSGGVPAAIGGYLLWGHLRKEAENRIRQDLNAAREFYQARLRSAESALFYTAVGERFASAVSGEERAYLGPRLDSVKKSSGMDLLWVVAADGRVIHRSHDPARAGDKFFCGKMLEKVLAGEAAFSGTLVMTAEELASESAELARRARIPVIETPKARTPAREAADSGMTLAAAAAVRGPGGKVVGMLAGATLLNRNYELVDQVQNTVFRDERYRGQLIGTSTLFLDDVRVSTNVQLDDGTRAVGSMASRDVYEHVLGGGQVWVGSAWVVNDWYLSAYEPIADLEDRNVGMLYVGERERKFSDMARSTFTVFALVISAAIAAAVAAAWKLADRISRPARELSAAAQAVAGGDFTKVLAVRSEDEIGALTRAFNTMAHSLGERDQDLKERARLQLARSERLASIGRLAAGVAHEINNPLTGVLTFAHMLRKDSGEGTQARGDAETIVEAATRCKEIVRGLLDFSRQTEAKKQVSDLNEALARASRLASNQAKMTEVEIVETLAPDLPRFVMDQDQIQQVAVNLLMNSLDAMPGGGKVTLSSRLLDLQQGRFAEFEVSDTGVGIPKENLDRIFDPFFTTKPAGKGTGLGLAIAYGIVAEHGGQMKVASEVGKGTSVRVILPVQQSG